ncbi:unnamed protein product [Citrullus colocynthis]|uniref:Uncharacterized protein n=1 Tax=Citrullus colocynthis TaxID=252529 RepID=A0ABP0YM18_9ROSI
MDGAHDTVRGSIRILKRKILFLLPLSLSKPPFFFSPPTVPDPKTRFCLLSLFHSSQSIAFPPLQLTPSQVMASGRSDVQCSSDANNSSRV